MGSIQHACDTDTLLSKLTLEEKVSLLAAVDWWRTPVIDKDGVFVPHIKTTDGPNGARGESYVSGIRAACFPCGTNMGATFDTELLYRNGREIAKEAITKSANVLLAPTLNVIRSPLGGRNYETYSEDPFLLGVLSAAFVNGCQSLGIAATPKHFIANEAENRRAYLSVEVDEQTLREIYLLPFQTLMKLSRPMCFMTSYNRVNGTYVADSRRLVNDVLRKEWGFDGLVLSDWMGTYSTAAGLCAGVDLEMPGPSKWRGKKLLESVNKQIIPVDTIDVSAKRVLELAKTLGRFDTPSEGPEIELDDPHRDTFIRDAAADGMVLLKNDDGILPIPKGATVAIIGHLAKVASLGGGGSAKVNSLHSISPVAGLHALGIRHTFVPGVPVFGALPHADPEIVLETGKFDVDQETTRPVKLEWFNNTKAGAILAYEEMIPHAEYMIKEAWPKYLDSDYFTRMTFDITPITTGTHILSIITTGTATCYIDGEIVFTREQETDLKHESFYFFKAQLERRFPFKMTSGQRYTLTLESSACAPHILNSTKLDGKMFQGASLRFFEYVDISRSIEQAGTVAAASDYAIVCVGNTNEIESEGYDRDTMNLPGAQYDLIKTVASQNPRTIVVNFSGAPVTLTDVADQVPAILQAWFPGQECGHSVARILTGLVNPSGRLPFSWPRKLEDNPSYGNFPADNHDLLRYEEKLDIGYRFYDRRTTPDPLFPFGFGLSYTSFHVSGTRTSAPNLPATARGSVRVACDVRNTGHRAGKCVVQFYVQFPPTTLGNARPIKELKAFSKVELEPGDTKTLTVVLDRNSVSFYDAKQMCWYAKKGRYTVHVGTSVANIIDQVEIVVPDDYTWTGV